MGSIKWIAGFLGWVMVGPIGGLIGFLPGSAAESGLGMAQRMSDGQQPLFPASFFYIMGTGRFCK